jgi:hypothetical protein
MEQERITSTEITDVTAFETSHYPAGPDQDCGPDQEWQQPQLLTFPAPRVAGSPRSAAARSSSNRWQQVGLVGIAQAREALAEATSRAELRSEHQAA